MKKLLGLLLIATSVHARDYLDSLNGRGWSPDGTWVAFNPVGQNELFFLAPKSGKSYLLKPVGDVNFDTSDMFSAAAATSNRSTEAATVTVPAPGKSKLEPTEWAPDSRSVAYTIDRKTRGVFVLYTHTVTNRAAITQLLPWQSERDLRVAFELVAGAKDREARYWLRVVRPDGKVVKEVSFDNPKEIQQMGLLRFTEASFLSPNKQSLLYPKFSDKGWQLIYDPVASAEPAHPLTEPCGDSPLEWKLSPDSRYLAVAESTYYLAVGAVDDWPHAEKVPLTNLSMTIAWSADSRYLACNAREQLYLLVRNNEGDRIVADFFLVSDFCSPTFWGWRGTKLFFGDVRSGSTSIYVVDTDRPRAAEQIVKPREWTSAPRERTIAPDGSMFLCLMMEQNPEGQLSPQVWKIDLRPGAEWQKIYTFKPAAPQ